MFYNNLLDKGYISASVLKLLAYVSMLIDHAGRSALYYYLSAYGKLMEPEVFNKLKDIYYSMRQLGRFAFPVFCYFLVEGFFNTKNRKRYAGRLLVFAIISEIPFNLMLSLKVSYREHQNVLWTLLAGFIMLIILDNIKNYNRIRKNLQENAAIKTLSLSGRDLHMIMDQPVFVVLIQVAVMGIFVIITWFFKTDYKTSGIPLIFIFYLFREYRYFKALAGFCVFYSLTEQPYSIIAFLLIPFCKVWTPGTEFRVQEINGPKWTPGTEFRVQEINSSPRGPIRFLRRLNYLIYPVHMLIYYFITRYLVLSAQ